MEDLTILNNYIPKSLFSFGKSFVEFKGKNKNVIHQPRSVRIGKNCALRGHSFSQYRPLGWRITDIYVFSWLRFSYR